MTSKVQLETTDVDMPEFREFLMERGISDTKISDPEPIAGAGEIIEYRCEDRNQLVLLIREWFECGDEEVMQEMIAGITEAQ